MGIGSPTQLVFDESSRVSLLPIYGGEFFEMTPRVHILDKGGNLVTDDSTSSVSVSIHDNPSKSSLYSSNPVLTFIAKKGVVSLAILMIDKVGKGYRLNFNLQSWSTTRGIYVSTAVNLLSERFDVLPGPIRKIYSNVVANKATAGSQPFQIQPEVQLLDYGNNIITDTHPNSTATIRVDMIPSLASSAKIRIDSSLSTNISNVIESVTINLDSGHYGAGTLVVLLLTFKYEIWIESVILPDLRLSILTSNGTNAVANLAYSNLQYQRVKELTFIYRIEPGDTSSSLTYDGPSAFIHNSSVVIKSLNTSIDFTLPPSLLSTDIIVDTSAPCK